MAAPKTLTLDPESPASWLKFLDQKVNAGLRDHIVDVSAAGQPMGDHFEFFKAIDWIHFTAALYAGRTRGLEAGALRAYVLDCLGTSPVIYENPKIKEPMDLKEWKFGCTASLDPPEVFRLAKEHGLGDLALKIRRLALPLGKGGPKLPHPWEDRVAAAKDLVAQNRDLFRNLEFFGTSEDYAPTRAALGLLYVLKHEAPMWPFGKRRGKPPSEQLTAYYVLEKFLIPHMAAAGVAMERWAPGLDEAGRERCLLAAKQALGLTDWGSPRRVLLELLGAAGKEWVRPLLVEKAGYKNLALKRFLVASAVSRSRSRKTGQAEDYLEYVGLVALLHGGVLGFVFVGEHPAQGTPGAVTSTWVRGPKGYVRKTRPRRSN